MVPSLPSTSFNEKRKDNENFKAGGRFESLPENNSRQTLFPAQLPFHKNEEFELVDNACKIPVPWEFISQAPELEKQDGAPFLP